MKKLLAGAFMPHPPLIIPAVGKGDCGKVAKTVGAMKAVAADIVRRQPETVVIMTPHALSFRDAASVTILPELAGSMEKFAAPECRLNFPVDVELAEKCLQNAASRGVNVVRFNEHFSIKSGFKAELDSGAFVPLYYLSEAGFSGKIVHICPGILPLESMSALAVALRDAVEEKERAVAVIGSGDLSHYLKDGPPYGRRPEGAEFDRIAVEAIEDNDLEKLLQLDRGFIECAGECGLRSLVFVMALFAGLSAQLLSYEGPFGVGYAVAIWKEESLPLRLARWTLEEWLDTSAAPGRLPEWATELFNRKAGVFVSMHKDGKLRGCMGTFLPCQENLAREIEQNTLLAAREDPRFPPVGKAELASIELSVDVLSEPEKIPSMDFLDVKKYGVIVANGTRRGLLLPDLDGVDSVEEQVRIAMQKAGIHPDEIIDLYRFTVQRYDS